MTSKLIVHWSDGETEMHVIKDNYDVTSAGCLVAERKHGQQLTISPAAGWVILGERD